MQVLNKIKDIIEKISDGELKREIDEKYAGGFWDLALEIGNGNLEHVELLYNVFWEIVERTKQVECTCCKRR